MSAWVWKGHPKTAHDPICLTDGEPCFAYLAKIDGQEQVNRAAGKTRNRKPSSSRFLFLSLMIAAILPLPIWAESREEIRFRALTIEEGLSQNTANCILQDKTGFLYFGTYDGLNRYDGENFKQYKFDPQNVNSLGHNWITALAQTGDGIIWVGTRLGLTAFDPYTESFERYGSNPGEKGAIPNRLVERLSIDRQGRLWVNFNNQIIMVRDPASDRFTDLTPVLTRKLGVEDLPLTFCFVDTENRFWCFCPSSGLFFYRLGPNGNEEFRQFSLPVEDMVRGIWATPDGTIWLCMTKGDVLFWDGDPDSTFQVKTDINGQKVKLDIFSRLCILLEGPICWIGTNGKGLIRFDTQTGLHTQYRHDSRNPESLARDFVQALLRDTEGTLWVGTNGGGISQYSPSAHKFQHYYHNPRNPNTISDNFVMGIGEDSRGNLWIGTDGKGLNRYNLESKIVTRYTHDPGDAQSLIHNEVYSIFENSAGKLFVGTGGGLSIYNYDHDNFQRIPLTAGTDSRGRDRVVSRLIEGPNGQIFFGTYTGLNILDPETLVITPFDANAEDPESLASKQIREIFLDGSILWIGTTSGLYRIDLITDERRHFTHNTADPSGISLDVVNAIVKSPSGYLWIGTSGGGLNRLNPRTNQFKRFLEKDGLANNTVYGIQLAEDDSLWLSTNAGLIRMDPHQETFTTFTVRDGLQSNEFNVFSYATGHDGTLYFGGVNGLSSFKPRDIFSNRFVPPIVFTRFDRLNRDDDGRLIPKILSSSKDFEQGVHLKYDQNVFTVHFAALSYASPKKNRFSYKLEGFDKDWINNGSRRFVTYTNLDGGNYQLLVKGSNNDGVWQSESATLTIHVDPAPWETWWAISGYVLMGLLILVSIFHLQASRLAHERQVVRKLQEVDRLKDEFLANTSHELRTPLNGIIGLAESLVDGVAGPLTDNAQFDLNMIVASGKRLSKLVNDILDFSKLKHAPIDLSLSIVDLNLVADMVIRFCQPMSKERTLEFINEIPVKEVLVEADEGRLEQIFYNLIGNAAKFTKEGEIRVQVARKGSDWQVCIADTGIGIPKEKHDAIFNSFQQVDGNIDRAFGGTGLGLAITRKLVELQGGSLWVESEVNKGSKFYFTLPAAPPDAVPAVPILEVPQGKAIDGETRPVIAGSAKEDEGVTELKRQISFPHDRSFDLLIVDDDEINRKVLINHLRMDNLSLREAADGWSALEAIEKQKCDLVLLDVMMPRMSGYEVCRKIRESYSVHELPVIFLTARHQTADTLTGFGSGANDFLQKPISKWELLSRVSTHLQLLDITRNLEFIVQARTDELNRQTRVLVDAQKKLMTQEKMASLGTLTAGIAHEINTPVGIGVTAASFLQEKAKEMVSAYQQGNLTEDGFVSFLNSCNTSAELLMSNLKRASELIQSFKHVAVDRTSHEQRKFNVKAYLNDVLRSLNPSLKKTKISVRVEGPEDLEMESYPGCFSQIITNLVMNSLDHGYEVGDEGQLLFRFHGSAKLLHLTYHDDGKGIAPEHLSRIFDPFFTTGRGQGGSGLGLNIVYNLVTQQLGGSIQCKSHLGSGVDFIIKAPLRFKLEKAQEAVPSGLA